MKLKKSNDCWHIAMWRFKGHSMVVLNCGIPTIMLELTLISFCNIVNQITLHLKESRTRDLQLIFYILNLYTMQQLAFSPGSRDGGYVCACMCVTFALKNLHLFSHLSKKIGKVSLFIILHDLASHSSFLLWFSRRQCVLLDSSPSFTSPLETLSALLCWVWPQQCLWAQRDTSKHYGKPRPGSVSHFLWCVCCGSHSSEVVESPVELQAGLPPKLRHAEPKGLPRCQGTPPPGQV